MTDAKSVLVSLARACLLVASLFALIMASLPASPEIPGNLSDKVQHAVAFATLTLLASIAYGTNRIWGLFVGLAMFGAAIELIQLIPALNRQASLEDWLTDCVAIILTLVTVRLGRGVVGFASTRAAWLRKS